MPVDRFSHLQRARADSFGAVAAAYDRFRPTYPDRLIADLITPLPTAVLDIGCGTGKAGRLLAERGLPVLGLEPDPRMAEVARRHGLRVEVATFEDWDDGGRTFDLIISAQAWHWIDPARGAPKAARLLRRHGTLALFWNYDDVDRDTQAVIDAVLARHAPHLVSPRDDPRDLRPYVADLERYGGFTDLSTRTYAWERSEAVAGWVGRVGTHSDYLLLGEAKLAQVEGELTGALTAKGDTVHSTGGTYTILARTTSANHGRLDRMELLSYPAAAQLLGVPLSRVRQLVRDGQLVAVAGDDGVRGIPAMLVQDGVVVKSLPSVITQLRDARFADAEIVDWLFRADDSLPGSPIEALRANRGSEVKRRAQVAGY